MINICILTFDFRSETKNIKFIKRNIILVFKFISAEARTFISTYLQEKRLIEHSRLSGILIFYGELFFAFLRWRH